MLVYVVFAARSNLISWQAEDRGCTHKFPRTKAAG